VFSCLLVLCLPLFLKCDMIVFGPSVCVALLPRFQIIVVGRCVVYDCMCVVGQVMVFVVALLKCY